MATVTFILCVAVLIWGSRGEVIESHPGEDLSQVTDRITATIPPNLVDAGWYAVVEPRDDEGTYDVTYHNYALWCHSVDTLDEAKAIEADGLIVVEQPVLMQLATVEPIQEPALKKRTLEPVTCVTCGRRSTTKQPAVSRCDICRSGPHHQKCVEDCGVCEQQAFVHAARDRFMEYMRELQDTVQKRSSSPTGALGLPLDFTEADFTQTDSDVTDSSSSDDDIDSRNEDADIQERESDDDFSPSEAASSEDESNALALAPAVATRYRQLREAEDRGDAGPSNPLAVAQRQSGSIIPRLRSDPADKNSWIDAYGMSRDVFDVSKARSFPDRQDRIKLLQYLQMMAIIVAVTVRVFSGQYEPLKPSEKELFQDLLGHRPSRLGTCCPDTYSSLLPEEVASCIIGWIPEGPEEVSDDEADTLADLLMHLAIRLEKRITDAMPMQTYVFVRRLHNVASLTDDEILDAVLKAVATVDDAIASADVQEAITRIFEALEDVEQLKAYATLKAMMG